MTATPPPKRRNAEQSKARILRAAQAAFADKGYAQTGIREIATQADVSSPMLLRYFGSKAGLFEAALTDALDTAELLRVDRSRFGEHLARLLTNAELDLQQPSMIALAAADNDSKEIAMQVTRDRVLQPLAEWLGGADGQTRALQIMMIAIGFVMLTRQLPLIPTNAIQNPQHLCNWFADSIQAVVDQS